MTVTGETACDGSRGENGANMERAKTGGKVATADGCAGSIASTVGGRGISGRTVVPGLHGAAGVQGAEKSDCSAVLDCIGCYCQDDKRVRQSGRWRCHDDNLLMVQ